MGVSHNIRALMEREGIDEERLAKVAKVSPEAVQGWLDGKAIKTQALIKIIDTYGVSRDQLLGESTGLGAEAAAAEAEAKEQESTSFANATRENFAQNVYDKYKHLIAPPDGNVHVLMMNTFGSLGATKASLFDEKYTVYVDKVLQILQQQGRQIVDVHFMDNYGVGVAGGISYHTMILYR